MNYFVDPYKIFNNYKYVNFSKQSEEFISIFLKASKKSKYDTLFIGSSDLHTLFSVHSIYSNYFQEMAIEELDIKNEYIAIKNYLFLHPETKRVYVFISYPSLLMEEVKKLSNITNKNYSLKELTFLLLSKETTLKSLAEIKHTMKIQNEINKVIEDQIRFFPNHYYYIDSKNGKISEDIAQSNVFYLYKMIELFKEKNIDYTFVFPPAHSIYLAVLYSRPETQRYIDNIKRLLVNMSENDVYDFTLINKYSTVDYNEYDNYYWIDYVHSNGLIGYKVFKILHGDMDEPELYQLLNKNNIEKQLQKQSKSIEKYYKNNYDLVQSHIEKSKQVHPEYKKYKKLAGGPENIKKEYEEYRKIQDSMDLNNSVNHITKWKQ